MTKLSDIMNLDKAVTKLINLHDSNKSKSKHPVPPLALLYAEYIREGSRENEPNVYSYKDFVEIAKSPKEP